MVAPQHAPTSDVKEADEEKFQRLLRRMEHCAKAREASTRVLSLRFAERDCVRSSLQRESMAVKDALIAARKDSDMRWRAKMSNSPYLSNLAAESEKIAEEQRIRNKINDRKQQIMKQRKLEAETAVIQRVLNEGDELEDLRHQKKALWARERELQCMRDLEKTKARCARVDAERRHQQLEREHQLLQRKLKGGAEME
ncbi:unnamed protein product [Amoebophrya sp. A25]|nr:unnamed protein product [Amoebophrya sp. A25]|eukprot:GSA25T00018295001.1